MRQLQKNIKNSAASVERERINNAAMTNAFDQGFISFQIVMLQNVKDIVQQMILVHQTLHNILPTHILPNKMLENNNHLRPFTIQHTQHHAYHQTQPPLVTPNAYTYRPIQEIPHNLINN